MPSIKLRTCARTHISIGSNQSSKSWVLVQAAECSATDFVLLLPMAWSPPAWQRRNRLGWTTRRLRHFQFPPIPLRHQGLDEFRELMLADNRVRSIDDYLSASDVFPGVGLKGGVCYFLWDRDNPGPCRVTTQFKDEPPSTASRPLLEEGVDVFIRFNEGLSILKKVAVVETGET